jgi:hypothetical protein
MSTRHAGAIVLAVPGCLAVAVLTAGLLAAVFDQHPMWPRQQLNLSEAAAVRDLGEIVRLIELSEDPDAPRDVRPGFLADQAVRATPLEAAIAVRDTEVVRVLLVNGAALDAQVWSHLRCAAEGDEMTAYLDRRRPLKAIIDCAPQTGNLPK